MKATHKNIVSVIASIRHSFPDATIIYTYGACFGFCKIVKAIFPESAYFKSGDGSHAVVLIGGVLYDIKGELMQATIDEDGGYRRMTKKDVEYWDAVVDGQRVERMLQKYSR